MEEDRTVEMSEEQTGALVQVVLQGAYPVSYTHLDVYKRQGV